MTQGYNPFAGMKNAQTSVQGQYLTPGRYTLEITKMLYQKLNAGGEALIVECKVLKSDNEKHPVGASRTWFQKVNQSFQAEAKLFCYAAVGYDVKNPAHDAAIKSKVEPVCEEIMLKALTEGRLNGRQINADVFDKPKKANPSESYTKHVFSPAQDPLF